MVIDARASPRCCRASSSSPRGTRARGAQRAVRRRLPQALQPRAGHPVAPFRGARHRGARPAHPAARRGAQLQAGDAGSCLPRLHHAQPPGAVRRPRHGRRPARPVRTARPARRHARSRRCPPSRRGSRRLSARSATWPTTSRQRPASISFAIRTTTSSTSARPGNLRARVRTYFTESETRTRMGEMVVLAQRVEGSRLRHRAGGTGARGPAHRPAPAAVQPPLEVPATRTPGSSSPASPGRDCPWSSASSTTTPTTSARSAAGVRRRCDGRPARHVPHPPVHAQAGQEVSRAAPVPSPRSATACHPATARSSQRRTTSKCSACSAP